ncbi:MAG: pantoate--beta-alanine ligase [Acidimicrobiales bacterium]|nr:pantoate--beta-alanine ligase [Acidimicrobiales bacterium]
MRIVTAVGELRATLDGARSTGGSIGFVPTMGALHDGHASLMRRASGECDVVVASIFVNPLQFGPTEDLAAYPRTPEHDRAVAEAAGVDVLFVPHAEEMYPEPMHTTVTVSGVSEPLEGRTRPTHFAGVATVVAKLFGLVGPCRAYFGEKDYQQLAVIRTMVRDLSLPVQVVGCATVREPDGLALSSRNAYLGPAERAAATVLHRALLAGRAAVEGGQRDPALVREIMADLIGAEPLAELDYAEVVRADTLQGVGPLAGELRLLAAARIGSTRLIDNLGVTA